MKKVILSSIFAGVTAVTVASLVSSAPAMLDQRLKLQEPAAEVQATEATSQSVLESLTKKKMMTEKELREFAAVTKVMQLDSIIGAAENGLVLQQRQYFMYDTHKYPVKRLNSYWNTATHKWDTAETYEYVWDEDGYCLEQSAYSETTGQRYQFQYNDRHLGIVQILSNYENGVWVPIQRGDYTYDGAGNITEEVISQWNATTKDWDKVQKNAASWDTLNRQTSYAQYAWNGTKWVGSGERKNFEYLNDTSNTYSLNGWSIWDTTTGEWVYFMKREFNWNELGQLTSQVETYFNEDTQKWDGCYDWYNVTKYNKKTIINYDEKHRITSEPYYEAHEIGDYTLMSDIKHVWSDIAEGGSQEVLTSIVYRNNRAPWAENYVLQDSTIKQYNAAGNPTLSEEWHIRGVSGPLYRYQKNEKTYDANGFLASELTYGQNRQDPESWLPVSATYITNDAEGHEIEKIAKRWQASENDWVNNNRFTSKYDHGLMTENLAYRWRDGEWTPNWGNGYVYDFDMNINQLVLWPGADFYYKLDEMRSYSGDGADWMYFANTYHYSKLEESNGIEGIAADSNIRISYAHETVIVESEDEVTTNIFDAAGRCVVATSEKNIDLSAYPAGLYIVKAGDASKKIVK